MAASAEYELEKRVERLDLFPVELDKGEKENLVPMAAVKPSTCMETFRNEQKIKYQT